MKAITTENHCSNCCYLGRSAILLKATHLVASLMICGAAFTSADLVSYWGFYGDASDAAGNHNGTLVGGATVSGGALQLGADGDYVDFANPTAFDFNSSFTWTARIRTTDDSGAIFSRNPRGADWNLGSNALFVRSNEVQWDTGWVGNPGTGVTVNDGNWHLVIVTFNAITDHFNIFVDPTVGVTAGQFSDNFDVNSFNEHTTDDNGYADTSFTLGQANFTGGLSNLDTLIGSIDDAAIFDTALTGAELDRLILSGAVVFSPLPGLDLSSSAIPMNLALGQIAGSIHRQAGSDINSRLFQVRSRSAADVLIKRYSVSLNGGSPLADIKGEVASMYASPNTLYSSGNWEFFADGVYGEIGHDVLGGNPGFDAYTYSGSFGAEYKVNEQIAIGLGLSHVWSDNKMNSNLGSVDVEGDALSLYGTYFKNNFWTDLLYSYGIYEADIRRNSLGGISVASPDIKAHKLSLNLGYNIEADPKVIPLVSLTKGDSRFVHGPTLGIDYANGALAGYTETGNPGFDATFGDQDYDSLITNIGWQATLKEKTSWGQFSPQLRIGYGRENLSQGNSVTGSIASDPLTTATGTDTSPGSNWLDVGAGVSFAITDSNVVIYADYNGQFFRQSVDVSQLRIGAKISF